MALLLFAGLLSGCGLAFSKTGFLDATAEGTLKRGQTAEEVRQLVGSPDSTKSTLIGDTPVEVWQYKQTSDHEKRSYIGATVFSLGLAGFIPVPAREEHFIVFANGKVVSWDSLPQSLPMQAKSQEPSGTGNRVAANEGNNLETKSAKPVKVYRRDAILPPMVTAPLSTIAVLPSGPPSIVKSVEPAVEQAIYSLRRLYTRIKVIDRTNLSKIEDEQAFQNMGAVPAQSAVKFGKMVGAQQVLAYQIQTASDEELDSIRKQGGTISSSVSVRLIQVETGELLFQTVTFDNRQIDSPQNHGQQQWPEVKLWRLHSIEAAGEQAIADLEVALLWGPLGWHIVDMPAGRLGALVRTVYPGGLAALAGIQPNDLILKIETPTIPQKPPGGFWVVFNKETLLNLIMFAADRYDLTVARNGKDLTFTLWIPQREAKELYCASWRQRPERIEVQSRIKVARFCNFGKPIEPDQESAVAEAVSFVEQRLKDLSLSSYKQDFLLAWDDLYAQNPKVLDGATYETQFQRVLAHMKTRLAKEGRPLLPTNSP